MSSLLSPIIVKSTRLESAHIGNTRIMPIYHLAHDTDWDGWRLAARQFILAGIEPMDLLWRIGGRGDPLPARDGHFNLPRAFVSMLAHAFQVRQAERFGLLYSLIWRVHAGEPVWTSDDDPDLRLAREWGLMVRADAHRMRTHLRFTMADPGADVVADPGADPGADAEWIGWFTPDHWVLEANARLFARRNPGRSFTIVTPDGTAHWNQTRLRFGAGLKNATGDDTLLAWWESHRDTILTTAHEGFGIQEAEDLAEVPRPVDRSGIGPVVLANKHSAASPDLVLRARECERCSLYGPATQTVFGEGPSNARIMFIGEQPGDQEDTIGRPFVGPAGQLLDEALEAAGIDRREIYITNAVKHFKFTQRGKQRIHQSPSPSEIDVCRFWLEAERAALNPALIVLLGGSAGRALLGRPVAVTRERGRPLALPDGTMAFLTVHPSYLLRQPNGAAYAREYAAFVKDLIAIREQISSASE